MLRLAFLATLALIILKALSIVSWPWLCTLIPLIAWLAYIAVMTGIGLAVTAVGLGVVWWVDRKGMLD